MSNSVNTGRVFNLTAGSGDMAASIYDPSGKRTDIFAYAERLVQQAFEELYDNLLKDHAIYRKLYDSAGNAILGSNGEEVIAKIAIEIK